LSKKEIQGAREGTRLSSAGGCHCGWMWQPFLPSVSKRGINALHRCARPSGVGFSPLSIQSSSAAKSAGYSESLR